MVDFKANMMLLKNHSPTFYRFINFDSKSGRDPELPGQTKLEWLMTDKRIAA